MPGWKEDNFSLRYALKIPDAEIWQAHQEAKTRLIERVNQASDAEFDDQRFTLAFARRSARYKRSRLLFQDRARLHRIAGFSRRRDFFLREQAAQGGSYASEDLHPGSPRIFWQLSLAAVRRLPPALT